MTLNRVLGAAIAAMTISTAAGAQGNMTYTGCLEAVNHGGMFLLTRVDDGMTMKKEETPMDHSGGAMATKAMVLVGASNLRKHVGRKVSVTGTLSNGAAGTMRQDLSTLNVKTLKVVAKSCS
jgi:hypothetical protein